MSTLFRAAVTSAALALAAALAAAPADAQEYQYRRPHQQHGPGAGQAPGPAAPFQAQQPRHRGVNGAGVAAGVIGGLAAGAILGGILSNGAAARPAPVEEVEGPPPGCPLVRQPVYDGSGRFAGYQALPSC